MGRLLLGMGALLSLGGCAGPQVVPYAAPVHGVSTLDPLEKGEMEVAGGVENIAYAEEGLVAIVPALLIQDWFSAPIRGHVGVGFGRVELGLNSSYNHKGFLSAATVGVHGPTQGAWETVVDVGYGWQRAGGVYTPEDQNGNDLDEVAYAYRLHAPTLRLRAVWQPNEQVMVPVSVTGIYSTTTNIQGLSPGQLRQQSYLDLGAGVIWDPGPGCLQWGVGLSIDPREPNLPRINSDVSCQFSVGGAQ
ncbi:MAG: hypothetical protein ACI9VR_001791 [Cognaticolwellia sp.]|jgi:hypothetical protein